MKPRTVFGVSVGVVVVTAIALIIARQRGIEAEEQRIAQSVLDACEAIAMNLSEVAMTPFGWSQGQSRYASHETETLAAFREGIRSIEIVIASTLPAAAKGGDRLVLSSGSESGAVIWVRDREDDGRIQFYCPPLGGFYVFFKSIELEEALELLRQQPVKETP